MQLLQGGTSQLVLVGEVGGGQAGTVASQSLERDRLGGRGDGWLLVERQPEGCRPGVGQCSRCRGQLQTGQCPGADGAGHTSPGRAQGARTDRLGKGRRRARTETRLGEVGGPGGVRAPCRVSQVPGTLPRAPALGPRPPPWPTLAEGEEDTTRGREAADQTVWPCGLPGMKLVLAQRPQHRLRPSQGHGVPAPATRPLFSRSPAAAPALAAVTAPASPHTPLPSSGPGTPGPEG